ncbi:MAG TPA: response regulator [Opitutaceae bacterium]|nr:response regulator [Opitutaceae bacterium]
MKALVVEDDPIARAVLEATLRKFGHESASTPDGEAAWDLLKREPYRVIISDWMMPKTDGLELCRRVRAREGAEYVYFILLTARGATEGNQEEAMQAGVDDFLTKPLNPQELRARLHVAARILEFTRKVRQLEEFLPMCSYCKKIRDDRNFWGRVEDYINSLTGAKLSHSICPDCYDRVVVPEMRAAGMTPPPLPKANRVK